jgi:hypothetical protein
MTLAATWARERTAGAKPRPRRERAPSAGFFRHGAVADRHALRRGSVAGVSARQPAHRADPSRDQRSQAMHDARLVRADGLQHAARRRRARLRDAEPVRDRRGRDDRRGVRARHGRGPVGRVAEPDLSLRAPLPGRDREPLRRGAGPRPRSRDPGARRLPLVARAHELRERAEPGGGLARSQLGLGPVGRSAAPRGGRSDPNDRRGLDRDRRRRVPRLRARERGAPSFPPHRPQRRAHLDRGLRRRAKAALRDVDGEHAGAAGCPHRLPLRGRRHDRVPLAGDGARRGAEERARDRRRGLCVDRGLRDAREARSGHRRGRRLGARLVRGRHDPDPLRRPRLDLRELGVRRHRRVRPGDARRGAPAAGLAGRPQLRLRRARGAGARRLPARLRPHLRRAWLLRVRAGAWRVAPGRARRAAARCARQTIAR